MSTNYQLNRDQVITGALRICSAIDPVETPTAVDITTCSEALNLLCASWENRGLPLWKIKEHIIPLVEGQAEYVINTARPLEVTNAVLHNNLSDSDITMVRLARQEYLLLGIKSSTGVPTQYYYEYDTNQGSFFVYPTPSNNSAANMELRMWYREPFTTVESSTDIPDFPKEFVNALKWNLAANIAHEYSVPLKKIQMIEARAEKEADDAFDYNIEHTSVYFNPSRYGGYQ